jgi:thiosulfate reductase cytochrome b subunit
VLVGRVSSLQQVEYMSIVYLMIAFLVLGGFLLLDDEVDASGRY